MAQSEVLFFWVTVALTALGSLLYAHGVIFVRPGSLRAAGWATSLALGSLSLVILSRWLSTGHGPVMYAYENCLAAVWMTLGAFLVLQRRWPGLAVVGVAIAPASVLTLGFGAATAPELEPSSPAFEGGWFLVHFVFSWAAYVAFFAATVLAGLVLWKRWKELPRRANSMPSPDAMTQLIHRLVLFGLVTDVIMLASGAIWARQVWGHYWAWEPMETWSLISLGVYLVYPPLRLALRWRETQVAWFLVVAFVAQIVSVWGVGVPHM